MALGERFRENKDMVLRYTRDALLDYLVQYWLLARAAQEGWPSGSRRAVHSDRTLAVLVALRDAARSAHPEVEFHRERQAISVRSDAIADIVAESALASTLLKREPAADLRTIMYKGQPVFGRTTAFVTEELFINWRAADEPLDVAPLLDSSLRKHLRAAGVPLSGVAFGGVVIAGTVKDRSSFGVRHNPPELSDAITVQERGALLSEPLAVPRLALTHRASWLSGPALHTLRCDESLIRPAVRDVLRERGIESIDAGGLTLINDGQALGLPGSTVVTYTTDLAVAASALERGGFAPGHLIVAAADATPDVVRAVPQVYEEFRTTAIHLLDREVIFDAVSIQPWNWSAHANITSFSFVLAEDSAAFHALFRRHEQSVDLPASLPLHPSLPSSPGNWRFVGLPGSGKSIALSQAILAHARGALVLFIEPDASAADLVVAQSIVRDLQAQHLLIVLDDLHQFLASERIYVLDEVVQFLRVANVHIVAAYTPLRRDQLREEHHAFFARVPFTPETSLVATPEFFRQVAWHAGAALGVDENEPRVFAVADAAFLHDPRPASLVRELRQFQGQRFDPLVIERLRRSTYERWADDFSTLCHRNPRVADVLEIIGFYRYIGLRYSMMRSIERLFTEFLCQPVGEFRSAVAILERAHLVDVQERVRERDGMIVEVLDGASTIVRPEMNAYLDGRANPARYARYMEWLVAHQTNDDRERQIDLEYIATKYTKLGRFADALRVIERSAAEVPPSNIHAALAMAAGNTGDYDRAVEEMHTHVREYPKQFSNWLTLARTLLGRGAHDYVRACMREYLSCALRESSSDKELFKYVLNMVGHRDDILAACGFLLEHAGTSEGVLEAVLCIFVGYGAFDEAMAVARRLAEHPAGIEHVEPIFASLLSVNAGPLEYLIFATAALYVEGGKGDAYAVITKFPVLASALRGEAAYRRGDWPAAAKDLRVVFETHPALVPSHLLLFSHYVASTFFSNEVDLTITLIERSGVRPAHLRPSDAFVYGSALFYRGRYDEALPLLQRVDPRAIGDIAFAPWQRLSAIARVHLARGENEQAAAAADEILRTINEFDAGAHVVRAAALSRLGQDPLPHFVPMDYSRLPADDRLLLAEAFLRSGHPDSAVAVLEAVNPRDATQDRQVELDRVLALQSEAVRAACRVAMS